VWVALLNLENSYGQPPAEAAAALLARALQYTDAKKMYLAALGVFERTPGREEQVRRGVGRGVGECLGPCLSPGLGAPLCMWAAASAYCLAARAGSGRERPPTSPLPSLPPPTLAPPCRPPACSRR
jgi:rRNA biogenesis protein RRP5